MGLVSIVSDWHVVHDLRRAVLVLNTPGADMSTVRERLLGVKVQVVVLHHTVVVAMLAVGG